MQVFIELTDEEVRDVLMEKVYSMLPDDVLEGADSEVSVSIVAHGQENKHGNVEVVDLTDTKDWRFDLKILAETADHTE